MHKQPARRFFVRDAIEKDAISMQKVARLEDRQEWQISVVGDFQENLRQSIRHCRKHGEVKVVIDSVTFEPMMLGGAQPQAHDPSIILTWLVVSHKCMAWALTFMKDYREDLEGFFGRWPKTECYSDSRNVVHHRWLRYLGYEEVEEVLWGPYDLPFLHFRKGF
jgi:hypothetical protein